MPRCMHHLISSSHLIIFRKRLHHINPSSYLISYPHCQLVYRYDMTWSGIRCTRFAEIPDVTSVFLKLTLASNTLLVALTLHKISTSCKPHKSKKCSFEQLIRDFAVDLHMIVHMIAYPRPWDATKTIYHKFASMNTTTLCILHHSPIH